MEKKIIASACVSRENFANLEKFNIINDLSEQGKILYELLQEFYERDPSARYIDLDLVTSRVQRDFPNQQDIFLQIIRDLPTSDEEEVSVPNLLDEIAEIKKENIGRELSSQLLRGDHTSSQIVDLMEEYREVDNQIKFISEGSDVYHAPDIEELFSSISEDFKIKLYPEQLNSHTNGGALPGHNILVFGRPEVGKSLFTINLAAGFLNEGKRVLYIENEDPSTSVLSRLVCRLAEMTSSQVLENPQKAQELAVKGGYENFVLKSMSPGTFYEIEGLIERYSPLDVVILNQLRNFYVGNKSKVEQMETVATRARNLAKGYDLIVVGVTQAGDSAENKLVLEMGDIDFSNTGMPGQMDLIIGLGVNSNWEQINRRMISLPKNKLSGEHSYFPVTVDTKINKILDL